MEEVEAFDDANVDYRPCSEQMSNCIDSCGDSQTAGRVSGRLLRGLCKDVYQVNIPSFPLCHPSVHYGELWYGCNE